MNGDYVKDTLEGRQRSTFCRGIATLFPSQPFGDPEEKCISCASPFVSSSTAACPSGCFLGQMNDSSVAII